MFSKQSLLILMGVVGQVAPFPRFGVLSVVLSLSKVTREPRTTRTANASRPILKTILLLILYACVTYSEHESTLHATTRGSPYKSEDAFVCSIIQREHSSPNFQSRRKSESASQNREKKFFTNPQIRRPFLNPQFGLTAPCLKILWRSRFF